MEVSMTPEAEDWNIDVTERIHDIAGYLHTMPEGVSEADLNRIGDRLSRLRDEAYMAGREAEVRTRRAA